MLKDAVSEKAVRELGQILSRCDIPISRTQWAAWFDNNIAEFRDRMKTAPARRRAGNIRLRARDHLPAPAKRLQPAAAARVACRTQWANNLSGRCGWHGFQTNSNKFMIFLVCNGRVTYYIDLEPNRLDQAHVRYALMDDFDLEAQLHLLTDLENAHPDDEVRGTFSFEVEGQACHAAHGHGARHGIIVKPVRGTHITAPLPKPARGCNKQDDAEGEEEQDEDEVTIMEDILGVHNEDAMRVNKNSGFARDIPPRIFYGGGEV